VDEPRDECSGGFVTLRIGYVPYRADLTHPGDRRRFCYYAAKRGLEFEIADPSRAYDIVILSEAADVSRWRHFPRDRGRIVYDLIDSYLADSSTDWRTRFRGIAKFASRQTHALELNFKDAIRAMCRRADAVVCTTVEQQQMISPLCANVRPILDFQTRDVRHVKTDYSAGDVFHFVWEGQGGNVVTFSGIREALANVAAAHPIAVHLVTDLEYPLALRHVGRASTKRLVRQSFDIPNVYLYEWNEAMFSTLCTACDMALIPIPLDVPIYRGKPENKLQIFWRMGIPVLTSATPAYSNAMARVGLDMSCTTTGDWIQNMKRFINDEALRRDAGLRGRRDAETNFNDDVLLAAWDRVIASVMS
jgi:hypothetical protein